MCIANNAKMLDKLRLKNPIAKKLEQDYGIRPHGVGFMIGKREGNLYYQKGGRGYQDPKAHLVRNEQVAHRDNIANRRG